MLYLLSGNTTKEYAETDNIMRTAWSVC